MRHHLWGAGLVLASLLHADPHEIKVYCAPRLEGIVLDGKLSEPSWKKAALVGGFTLYGTSKAAQPPTFFRAGYDDRFLYFGILCEEPKMKGFAPVAQARDAHAVFGGETIEIFVDPRHSHSDYYQFAINAAGSIYDSHREEPLWNADLRCAVATASDSWSLEVAIPWKDLGVSPKPGALLGFNVCRDRHLGEKQWTNWARVIGGFHDPQRFGHLLIDGNAKTIGAYGREFRKGGREGPIVVYTADGFADSSYQAIASASIQQLRQRLTALEKEVGKEKSPVMRRELTQLIDSYRRQMKELESAIQSTKPVDARSWSKLDLRITQLAGQLDGAVWTARLKALLAEI